MGIKHGRGPQYEVQGVMRCELTKDAAARVGLVPR